MKNRALPLVAALMSAAFLVGMWVERFVRVMWVEDVAGASVVDVVNQPTPAGTAMTLAVAAALAVSLALVVARTVRRPAPRGEF